MDDIRNKFYSLRNGHISYDQIMKVIYDDNIEKKTAAMYNASANFRYIIPYLEGMGGTQLPAAQGDRLSLMKYWHGNRQPFLDSVYGTADYKNDIISMRMMGPKAVTFSLTPDINMVVGVAYNVQDASYPQYNSGKLTANNTWSHTITSEAYPFQDLNTYLFGASHLSDIGDISLATPRNIVFGQANKLKRIILGTDDADVLARYAAVGAAVPLVEMPKAVSNNLIEIDFHNLKNISLGGETTLSLTSVSGGVTTNLAPSLQRLDVRKSGITGIALGDYTPIEYIGFSDEMSSITLRNLPQLSTVEFDLVDKVQSIEIENCDKLNQLELLSLFQNKIGINKISCDNLAGGEDEAVSIAFMDWLYSIKETTLTGEIYVQSIADSELDKYRDKWTNLTIKLYQIFSDDVIFGVTGEGE